MGCFISLFSFPLRYFFYCAISFVLFYNHSTIFSKIAFVENQIEMS
uniref:Uncharacterized protein n=1 Tax=Anguilla anguilla TaxID=7936 RepID=A0A0E9VW94_ANGAN